MKYCTFKEFIRDAYYHGADAIAQPIHLDTEPYAPDIWAEVQRCLDKKLLDEAEQIIHATYKSIIVAGVITYLPTDEDVREAYAQKPI